MRSDPRTETRKDREARERAEAVARLERDSGLEFRVPEAQAARGRDLAPSEWLRETWFLVPDNDGEARRAVDLLRAVGAPYLRVSGQGWGATLAREGLDPARLAEELRGRGVARATIMEIPGEEFERELEARGIAVDVIDHHDYGYSARANPLSSLEQVMERLRWPASETDRAIAVNDRSYIPGLKALGLSESRIRAVRVYDLLAQGRRPADIERMFREARELLPSLTDRSGVYVLDHLGELESYVKQELAIRARDGRVNALTWEDRKLGFSGDPAIVERLFNFDYASAGFADPPLERYAGGDPESSRYFGLKVKAATERSGAVPGTALPRTLLDRVWDLIETGR